MNAKQQHALLICKTDLQGAVKRFGGNERLYISCLEIFLDDPTMAQLNEAVATKAWDDAFTSAHALKGLAGNLGFVPLLHSTGRLVTMMRGRRTREVKEYMAQIDSDYQNIIDAIREIFISDEMKGDMQ